MVQSRMLKSEAINSLGGSISSAADAIGVSYQAVDKWPEQLTPRIADRVQAALWRVSNGVPHPKPRDHEKPPELRAA